MSIFGTSPEAIKLAPLVKEIEKNKNMESVVCVTAQHEMLDRVLELFDIIPDYDLNIMKSKQSLVEVTNRAISGLDDVISKVKPNIVLVHGDTTTTFAGSVAAFYNKVKIGHVEAGLRTYDKYSPFPEEMNRQLAGVLTDLHFAPTEKARENLLKENKEEEKVFVTGSTAIDALKTIVQENYHHEIFDKIGKNRMILLTAHRRENWGDPMRNIFKAVKRIVQEHNDVQVVYPVHLNPIVRQFSRPVIEKEIHGSVFNRTVGCF